jgi:regulator of replication initiation timing
MVEIVQSIQAGWDIAKKLREYGDKIKDADFKSLLADLQNDLSDARMHAADLKDEIAQLRTENSKLKEELARKVEQPPQIHDGAYIFNGTTERHYCTACYDDRGKKILVSRASKHFEVFGKWECPSCKASFG